MQMRLVCNVRLDTCKPHVQFSIVRLMNVDVLFQVVSVSSPFDSSVAAVPFAAHSPRARIHQTISTFFPLYALPRLSRPPKI